MEETDDDIDLFNSRHKAIDDMPAWAMSVTHIAYRNNDVDVANRECLRHGAREIHRVISTHSILPNARAGDTCQPLDEHSVNAAFEAAQEPNSTRDRVVPKAIDLAISVPVTLTHNLAQTAGLCNGTKAIVHDFIYASNTSLPVVLVQVQDKYLGPSFYKDHPHIVPVPPQVLTWVSKSKHVKTTRMGLPLRLAFAMTIHKAQGLTCSKLVFNPAAIPTSTYAYVGLSRVRHRDDALLTQALKPITTLLQRKTRDMRHEEWVHLDALNVQVRAQTSRLIAEMQSLAMLENNNL